MEKMIKRYVVDKVVEFAKTSIYRSEIVNAGKAGLEKFNAVVDKFWDKAEEYIEKEKQIDRKWIPDTVEELGETAIHQAIIILREELDPQKLIQEIFDIEKKEYPKIL